MPPSRREDLIESAVAVFSRDGFRASGLDKVLRERGISRMTLYNHFKSKDELIVAALNAKTEAFIADLHAMLDAHTGSPRDKILAIFEYHERWMASDTFHGCLFSKATAEFSDPTSPIRRAAADQRRQVEDTFTSLCAEAGYDDPRDLARQLSVALSGAVALGHELGQVKAGGGEVGEFARTARRIASQLLTRLPADSATNT